jgi:hypothetical protein
MDLQVLCEGCYRRKQPLLKANKGQSQIPGFPRREIGGLSPDGFAIFGKLSGQKEFRRIAR